MNDGVMIVGIDQWIAGVSGLGELLWEMPRMMPVTRLLKPALYIGPARSTDSPVAMPFESKEPVHDIAERISSLELLL